MSQREARNGPPGVVETKAGAQPRSPTPNDAAAALHAAVEHHQADRLDEAEALYRRILRSHPEHPDALNLLGVIVQQRGEHATAEELIRKAIRSSPRVADYHNNLGKVLVRQGKIDEAVAYFRKAERLGPRDGRNIAAFRISFLDEDKARKGEPYVKRLKDVLVDTAYWSILDRDKIYSRETHGKNLANSPFIIESHKSGQDQGHRGLPRSGSHHQRKMHIRWGGLDLLSLDFKKPNETIDH